MASVDYLLRVQGIEGESADDRHRGWIDVDSWSWGAVNAAPGPGGGGAAGRVSMQDLHVVLAVSRASPPLFLACASGKRLPEAKLVALRAGERREEFLSWTFSDVVVTSFQTGGAESGEALPMDHVSFAFTKVLVEYRPMRPDGSLDAPVKAGWDVRSNAPL
jgi:type VI secretion system secreted protein Hcp